MSESGPPSKSRWGSLARAVPNKRELLARAFGRLGILRLLERTVVARRPGLLVLTYHRISDRNDDPFYDPVISANAKSFAAQMDWLKSHVNVVTLDEVLVDLERGQPLRESRALVTFDDGYRDNFDVAVPILRDRGIPATFFLPTEFLESPRLTWWDHVAYVVKKTAVRQFVLDRGLRASLKIDLDLMTPPSAVRSIVNEFLEDRVTEPQLLLAELDEQAEVVVDENTLGRKVFMGWDDARSILADTRACFSIGSHTHTHRKLADLDEETQTIELERSKQIIETRLNSRVSAIAYPYGWEGAYTKRTLDLTAQTGYRLGFSAREGANRGGPANRFEIERLNVGGGDSVALLRARSVLHGAFGKSVL